LGAVGRAGEKKGGGGSRRFAVAQWGVIFKVNKPAERGGKKLKCRKGKGKTRTVDWPY